MNRIKYKELLKIVLCDDCCSAFCKNGKINSYGCKLYFEHICNNKNNHLYFEFDIEKFKLNYPQYKESK